MIYTVKKILDLVPEIGGLVKQAYAEAEFPTTSEEATLVSALQVNYLTKIANQSVDIDDLNRVATATRLYGLTDRVGELTDKMIKEASWRPQVDEELKMAEDIFNSRLTGFVDLEKVASQAETLYDEFSSQDDQVRLYAGAGKMIKSAAIDALNYRSSVTGKKGFTKLAGIIEKTNIDTLTIEDNRMILKAVRDLEKSAGYLGDFYRDAFVFTKEAMNRTLEIDLGGKIVKAQDVANLDKGTVGNLLGEDVAKILDSDLGTIQASISALPLPERKLLARLL